MAFILEEKITIGISACNYGALVRWNRKGWDYIAELGREMDSFTWVPVCPEVESGLGVPREPIRLVNGNGDEFWQERAKIKNKKGWDVSEKIRDGMKASMQLLKRSGVEAFIFMEGSPSCGVYRTTLKERRLGKPPGTFGSLLLKEDLFLIPGLDLSSPVKWWDWRRRLHAFVYLKRMELDSLNALQKIWHAYKFMCQEVDDASARQLGREMAGFSKKTPKADLEKWRSGVLRLLRKPSSFKRIHGVMQKHYSFYRKHIKPEVGKEFAIPHYDAGKRKYAAELAEMEKRAISDDFVFGGTPVVYRGGRW